MVAVAVSVPIVIVVAVVVVVSVWWGLRLRKIGKREISGLVRNEYEPEGNQLRFSDLQNQESNYDDKIFGKSGPP